MVLSSEKSSMQFFFNFTTECPATVNVHDTFLEFKNICGLMNDVWRDKYNIFILKSFSV